MSTIQTSTRGAGPGESSPQAEQRTQSPLVTERGRTTISDPVVAKVAGIAAREIPGVHEMGTGANRAFGAIKQSFGATTVNQGVSVEVGERQAAIDLDLVIDYGNSIIDVAAAVRDNVTRQVSRMTGLEVTEVNITIDDVHLEHDPTRPAPAAERRDLPAPPSRVQ